MHLCCLKSVLSQLNFLVIYVQIFHVFILQLYTNITQHESHALDMRAFSLFYLQPQLQALELSIGMNYDTKSNYDTAKHLESTYELHYDLHSMATHMDLRF